MGDSLIRIKETPLQHLFSRVVKRCFDCVFSILALIILWPIFLLIALAIKLTSPGSVFYQQSRVSQYGYSFFIYKFRTMPVDAENQTGPTWATPNESRSTPLGQFLRRSSLDELPQLWNVLKGEMSLIGPRPERPYFVQQFTNEISYYADRHLVKTGMTGWAQINGLRGNTSIHERTKFDLYYIKNWSLLFDIQILLRSFYCVIRDYIEKKAY